MEGWVYIITNKSIPNLIKIGYTTNDPANRARDLSSTGVPHPYEVEYQLFTNDPFEIEQKVHNRLSEYREGKEWFRCLPEYAVEMINEVAGSKKIHEKFNKIELPEKIPKIKEKIEKERLHWMGIEKSLSSEIEILKKNQTELSHRINQKVDNQAVKMAEGQSEMWSIFAFLGLIVFAVFVFSIPDLPYLLDNEPGLTLFMMVYGGWSVFYLLNKKFGTSKEDIMREKILKKEKNLSEKIDASDPNISEIWGLMSQREEIGREILSKEAYIGEVRQNLHKALDTIY